MGPGLPGQSPGSAAEDALRARVLGEQVRLLYGSPLPLAVNAVNALIVAAVVGPVLGTLVGAWVLAMAIVLGGRVLVRARYRRQPAGTDPEPWGHYSVLGAALTGALWGATAAVVAFVESPVYHLFVGLAAAGMAAGAVGALSFHLPSFYAFVAPALLPMAVIFAIAGHPAYAGIGAMALIFVVALAVLARNFNAALTESLRLRFANADLAGELTIAQDMADAARRSSWEIIAHISHELRTPLNAINGFADIICQRLFGPVGHRKYEEYARDISDSAAHLIALVDQILSFSRGHISTMPIDETVLDPWQEIAICLQMHEDAAARGRIELARAVDGELPMLRADPVKLRQILVNILSNAVKFTPPGGRIVVSAAALPDGGLSIAIADTGIGIASADLERVLLPYVQIENVLTRTRSGLGLGLPLAKQLVELHGGTLTLDSRPQHGTTVTLRFPAARCAPDAGDLLRQSISSAAAEPLGRAE